MSNEPARTGTMLDYWSTVKRELGGVLELLDELSEHDGVEDVQIGTPARPDRYCLQVKPGTASLESLRDTAHQAGFDGVDCVVFPDRLFVSIKP